jgi:hypothetical protein
MDITISIFLFLASLLTLLNESSSEIVRFSLQQLLTSVDTCWPEIADALSNLETFHESGNFGEKPLLSLLISKVTIIFICLLEYGFMNVLGLLSSG